jgi:hypothetical protein
MSDFITEREARGRMWELRVASELCRRKMFGLLISKAGSLNEQEKKGRR